MVKPTEKFLRDAQGAYYSIVWPDKVKEVKEEKKTDKGLIKVVDAVKADKNLSAPDVDILSGLVAKFYKDRGIGV